MPQYVVTGTSMVVEAENEQEAIERAEQMSGWHWEAEEVGGNSTRNIVSFNQADAEKIAGRPITEGEYRALVKSVEFLLPEEFEGLVHQMLSTDNDKDN